jgi:hypothetical protein
MPTLNRFPLLGLWAAEAARRLGYKADEAQSLGHAYAVLYAIRAQRVRHKVEQTQREPAAKKRPRGELLRFGGDDLEVTYDANGHMRGHVGGEPQTQASHRANVRAKFPDGYHERLQRAFRRVFKALPPSILEGRQVYNLYDQWKKTCGVGRRVDLDCLLRWCDSRLAVEAASQNRGRKQAKSGKA